MYFLLPLVSAVSLRTAEVSFAMYDPTYYMAIDFVAKNPVRFHGRKHDPGGEVIT